MFKLIIQNSSFDTHSKVALMRMPQTLTIENIGSGNGLVSSGNKPIPEPMVIQIYVAVWRD